jgi:hypothetical protein
MQALARGASHVSIGTKRRNLLSVRVSLAQEHHVSLEAVALGSGSKSTPGEVQW